ncbi:translation elongation factor-like protein [Baffinella frigidus]|nr:translation elongation factor-like protein [Cryptophyta sp. CCMP2293]
MAEKEHLSIVICGHVDSGKSTTTGHLLFALGGIPERELEKLKEEAANLGKSSFAFAFYMDRQKEERERGVTIACTTKEFYTEKWHYTIIDAPGHRDFIKNMISGAAQADVALLMVPADGNFTTAIQKGDAKAGEIQGQTRQHARILNLLGVKQLLIGINKMDTDVAGYKEARYTEIRDEMRNMLIRVGWKKDFVAGGVPVIPISGWMGDNLLVKSANMPWWNGIEVDVAGKGKMTVTTLQDCLNDLASPPVRVIDAPMRCPISGIYKIKGVGDVLAGRVEQGLVNPGEDAIFMPTHTTGTPCEGKIFTVEMHHKRIDAAKPGDNVGMNIKVILRTSRCGRAACRMTEINWKMGKETGGAKLENPPHLKANEVALATFEPMTPLVCDSFKNCEGLSRIAFLDGNTVMMLGKVITTVPREDDKKKK